MPLAAVRIIGGAGHGRLQVVLGGLILALVLFCLGWLAAIDRALLLHPAIWGLALALLTLAAVSIRTGLRQWPGQRVLLEYDADGIALGATLARAGQPWERLRRVQVREMHIGYGSSKVLLFGFAVPRRSGGGTTDRPDPLRWRSLGANLFDGPVEPHVKAVLAAAEAAGCAVGDPVSAFRGAWSDRIWVLHPPKA